MTARNDSSQSAELAGAAPDLRHPRHPATLAGFGGPRLLLNLRGRVDNMKLAVSSPLSPLFEAIVNSIQAVEPRGAAGRIEVHVDRDDRIGNLPNLDPKSVGLEPVRSFRIVDNGVGFTGDNMTSFETSDSRHKADVGGKGVGRLLWLKAFGEVQVASVYLEDGKWFRRTFAFSLNGEGITPPGGKVELVEKGESKTVVVLKGFLEPYKKNCPKGLDTIAEKIIDHCLSYFLANDCPRITISDGGDPLDLKEMFAAGADTKHIVRQSLPIRGHQVELVHVRRRSLAEDRHRIHLCANRREVLTENLSGFVTALPRHFNDDGGHPFDWSTFVYGKVLDDNVNSERGSFSLPKNDPEGPDLFPDDYLSMAALLDAVAAAAARQLEPFLVPIRKSTHERIESYAQRNPQYNHVLKYRPDVIERVAPDTTDQRMDAVLHEAAFDIEREVKGKFEQLLKQPVKNVQEFAARRAEVEKHLNEIGKAKLAQYVLHRRLMLDLLESTLAIQVGDKYALEESVHEIIFPLRATSHDVPYEQQNLWIVDEKLTYHTYLASDQELKKLKVVELESERRPDIVVFNSLPTLDPVKAFQPAHAFVAGDMPFSSIVIVEFKRPGRKDYRDKDNPIAQVYKYIEDITKGRCKDRDGRPISVAKDIPFFCYIISDLTEKLHTFARTANLRPAPDGAGYFGFNDNLKAYVEVVSYNKLVADAKKRNRVLFEKLQLPTTF
jgi:hypothetical protein